MEIKKKSLFNYVLFTVIKVGIAIILCLVINMGFFLSLVNSGMLLPANEVENYIEGSLTGIKSAEEIDDAYLYKRAEYLVLDGKNNIVKTNVGKKKQTGILERKRGYQYKEIRIGNGDRLIIRYNVRSAYRNNRCNKYLPSPDILLIIILIIEIILVTILVAYRSSKHIKEELKKIEYVTEKIKNKDLDFSAGCSDVSELNDVLISIDSLSEELKNSFLKEWEEKEKKKTEIAAISHDLKTPLTIVKCNTELLLEKDFEDNEKRLLNGILNNEKRIEQYVELLRESLLSEDLNISKEDFELSELYGAIEEYGKIIESDGKRFLFSKSDKDYTIYADKTSLERVLLNILSNAFEYSSENGTIKLSIKKKDDFLYFVCDNEGKGFSEEALKNGKNLLYSEHKERSGGKHYGLGLYVAETVAKSHDGELYMKNNENGAEVIFSIKL